jgi:chromate transporter
MSDAAGDDTRRRRLREIAWVFLKLGTIAFGGPAAHIAMMEDEVVRRRRWLSREDFLDYVAAANLIPGPNSTELAIHLGRLRGGGAGLLVAGACFILPATLIVLVVAAAYVKYGALPDVSGILYGIKPVIVAIVARALWSLGRSALKTLPLAAVAVVSAGALIAGIHELIVLAAAGALLAAPRIGKGGRAVGVAGIAGAGAISPLSASTAAAASAFLPSTMFWIFLKIGSVLFGSGYVLLAFLRSDFVERLGWLTESQLLDAVAVGQFTPGPVFTTATFIGYVLDGGRGAGLATLGIFLPAFAFVALSAPLLPRLRSAAAGAALDGVVAASFALMAIVAWHLARASVIDVLTLCAFAVASVLLLLAPRVNSAWLVLAGGTAGWLASRF